MGWIATALLTALTAAVAHHLGLVEKAAGIVTEIAKCPRCTVFWITFSVLLMGHTDLVISAAMSMTLAYFTDWFGLLLFRLAKMYERLWRRQRKRNREK